MSRPVDPVLATVIGGNVRDLRVSSGRTLGALAAAAGICESMLSKLERGLTLPSVPTLAHLALALGVQPGVLFEAPANEASA